MRESVRYLIKRGQLEIVTGGWVMTDEAAAHYYDMIDQLIEGHQFLRTEIGLTTSPVNGWSIDPFGHGMTFPYFLQKAGISNTLIERTHFGWKQELASKQQLEFVWKQIFDTSDLKDLFCQMSAFDLYSIKFTCGPNTDICLQYDFRRIAGEYSESTAVRITDTNIEERASLMINQYGRLASLFKHNVALVPLGDDFRFNYDMEWDQQYENYKKLMDHINKNPILYNKTQITFGTLNDYFTEVHQRMTEINGNNYPSLYGDFMPYADVYVDSRPHYWTGYYTTRPFWKSLSRELQNYLRSAEILYSLARNLVRQKGNYRMTDRLDKDYDNLSTARRHLALFQHHDAITGTSKELVMEDYGKKLNRGIIEALGVISHSVQFLLVRDHSVLPTDMNAAHPLTAYLFPDIDRPEWDGITQKVVLTLPPVEGRKIVIFNPDIHTRIELIRILVKNPIVKVIDAQNGNELQNQINPIFNTTAAIATHAFELEFIASLPPLSLTTFVIQSPHHRRHRTHRSKVSLFLSDANADEENNVFDLEDNKINPRIFNFDNPYDKDLEFETPYIKVKFDKKTGFLTQIYDKKTDFVQKTRMTFMAYKSADFYSGAYLFKPSHFDPVQNITERFPVMRLIKGELSSQLTVIYPNFIEVEYKVFNTYAPIGSALRIHCKFDVSKRPDLIDWELIMRIESDIDNMDHKDSRRRFYVDSNGFQMMERKYVNELGVEANYYPMTSALYIEDDISRLTLLSSHSHGVSSPAAGTVEVMLERKLRFDDNRGVGEGVFDNKLTISRFWVGVERIEQSVDQNNDIVPNLSQLMYSLMTTLLYEPIVLVSNGREDRPINTSLRFLDTPFDCDLFLVNLRTLPDFTDFNSPSMSSLLLVQNRDHSCRVIPQIDVSSLLCSEPKSRPKHLSHIRVQTINECSLTGLKSMSSLTDLSDIDVKRMQINAFNVTFVK